MVAGLYVQCLVCILRVTSKLRYIQCYIVEVKSGKYFVKQQQPMDELTLLYLLKYNLNEHLLIFFLI